MTGLLEQRSHQTVAPARGHGWRTPMMPVPWAAGAMGLDAAAVIARIEDGRIRWAWDIGLGDRLRELRVWTRCVITPHDISELTPSEVIDQVIGTRKERLRSSELIPMLMCCRQHILRLMTHGHLTGVERDRKVWVERRSLADFLLNRML